ncbi:phage tail protein [Halodesulfovibrio aestuarii]|uniref:Phage Tail Collar Domain n=1 Tax=Halodesulfovibrio aestuarii TaxID=126333 RepID=A0A8G2FAP9_9BACT|nr:phage tail protein [Halodesulfovibrio aestuarii]SHJ06261.1 Phage Tail Collar Domain [Halodesulfovibrio aestuarii]
MQNRLVRASAYFLASLVIFFAVSIANAGDSTSFNPTDVTVEVNSVGGIPIGGVIPWFSDTPPKDFLMCNGQSFSTSTYPKLSSALKGSSNVPDLRGVFIRGADAGRGIESGRAVNTYKAAQGSMTLTRQVANISKYKRLWGNDVPVGSLYPVYSTTSTRGDNWSNWGTVGTVNPALNWVSGGSAEYPNTSPYTYAVRFRAAGNNAGGPANVAANYVIRAK